MTEPISSTLERITTLAAALEAHGAHIVSAGVIYPEGAQVHVLSAPMWLIEDMTTPPSGALFGASVRWSVVVDGITVVWFDKSEAALPVWRKL